MNLQVGFIGKVWRFNFEGWARFGCLRSGLGFILFGSPLETHPKPLTPAKEGKLSLGRKQTTAEAWIRAAAPYSLSEA